MKRYAEKTGNPQRIYPHLCRHQLLTHLVMRAVVNAKLQILSSHASRKSFEIYECLGLADEAEKYQKAMKDFPIK